MYEKVHGFEALFLSHVIMSALSFIFVGPPSLARRQERSHHLLGWLAKVMTALTRLNWLPYLLACLTSKAMGRNELVCYQCQGHSLSECSQPKYLKACPNDQAYDRCETVLEKRGE